MIEPIRHLLEEAFRQDIVALYLLMLGGGLLGLILLEVFSLPAPRSFSRFHAKPEVSKVILGTFVIRGISFAIIIVTSLLLALLGQNADFSSLMRLIANSERSAYAAESKSQAVAKPSANLAPDFTLPSLEGNPVTLGAYKGEKGVVLVFFATWCVNCVKEVPEIKHLAQMAQKENVIVLAINYKQPEELVKRFKKSHQIDYRILLDTQGKVTTDLFGIMGLPHLIGINSKGEVVYRGTALPDKKDEFIKNLQPGL